MTLVPQTLCVVARRIRYSAPGRIEDSSLNIPMGLANSFRNSFHRSPLRGSTQFGRLGLLRKKELMALRSASSHRDQHPVVGLSLPLTSVVHVQTDQVVPGRLVGYGIGYRFEGRSEVPGAVAALKADWAHRPSDDWPL